MSDADREQRLTEMRDDLGQLTPDGIADEADGAVTVRAKSANGPTGMFKFMFSADGKVEGIAIELP